MTASTRDVAGWKVMLVESGGEGRYATHSSHQVGVWRTEDGLHTIDPAVAAPLEVVAALLPTALLEAELAARKG
jgi:hypothetical protein